MRPALVGVLALTALALAGGGGYWLGETKANSLARSWANYRFDWGVAAGWCAARVNMKAEDVGDQAFGGCVDEQLHKRRGTK